MRRLLLLASAAAVALAVPALAKDQGRGHGRGGDRDWSEHRGGGDRGNRGGWRGRHGWDDDRRAERRMRWRERDDDRDDDDDDDDDRGPRFVRGDRDDDARWQRRFERRAERLARWREGRHCPPGLARQNRYCMPPGQLRRAQAIGQRVDIARFAPVPQAWRYRFRDDDESYYRYGDDNVVYRIDRDTNAVASVIPLLADRLGIGDALPLGFDAYNLPIPYRDNFVDSADALYRYDDGMIYQVNPQTRTIESIVALLGGNPLAVGSPLPAGYDAYNLPLAYRDTYVEDADSLYRYSNGSIFEVDPQTMLVRALVEMIA